MKTLIIIPVFNEEDNIAKLLDDLNKYHHKYDVLVIDDASQDNSAEIVQRHEVPIIKLAANLGIGGAVQTGFEYAVANDYDITVQVDGDGQHDPAWIDQLINPIVKGDANCVIGSRYLRNNPDRDYKTPFLRRVGMIFSSLILFLASGKWITDTTSGFRALDRKTTKYFSNEYPTDHPEAEALLLLFQQGFIIKEIPVKMRSRHAGQSLFTWVKSIKYPFRVVVGFLGLLLKKK